MLYKVTEEPQPQSFLPHRKGKMYYSRTENQNFAENKLFEIRVPPYNVHSRSNAVEEPGFVYVIVGARVETDGGAESWGSWCTLL